MMKGAASAIGLASAALQGGHALLCGPAGNGKTRALRLVAARLRATSAAKVVRLRMAKMLLAADRGELDGALDAIVDTATRHAPSLILITELRLLACVDASDPASSSIASAGGSVQQQIATALLVRLRAAPRGVLVVGAIVDPAVLPACLRAHGGFELIVNMYPSLPRVSSCLPSGYYWMFPKYGT